MNFLPKNIEWVDPYTLSSNSYEEILIAKHKHSSRDWTIVFGWIQPIEDYTSYKIFAKEMGLPNSYPESEVPKDEIIAVGIFRKYGSLE